MITPEFRPSKESDSNILPHVPRAKPGATLPNRNCLEVFIAARGRRRRRQHLSDLSDREKTKCIQRREKERERDNMAAPREKWNRVLSGRLGRVCLTNRRFRAAISHACETSGGRLREIRSRSPFTRSGSSFFRRLFRAPLVGRQSIRAGRGAHFEFLAACYTCARGRAPRPCAGNSNSPRLPKRRNSPHFPPPTFNPHSAFFGTRSPSSFHRLYIADLC